MRYSKKDLKCFLPEELSALAESYGEKKFNGTNIFQWIQQKNVEAIEKITNISNVLRDNLKKDGFYISNLIIKEKLADEQGNTKYVFKLPDELFIEAVLLKDQERYTLCLSSQVGCKMNCSFCATAKIRYKRDLTAGEIVDQLSKIEADQNIKISNVVYMGMGEPLDNYDEVLRSIKIFNHPAGKNIGARKITISTCGIIPGIKKLADEPLQIRLAVSLHAHTDNIRNTLMPVNKKYPLEELIATIKEYQQKSGRRITFEYIMLEGVNDDRPHARGLMKLINGIQAHINLIEFNEYSGCQYHSPKHKDMKDFKWLLTDRGFETTIRYRRAREIKGACGQLGESL